MGVSIVNIAQMSDALRNTGYKNLESAVAEIVDNSIEANASEIFIILTESSNMGPKKRVKDIAVLDNGDGMNSDILNKSLGLGCTTRAARKSMGRFGVGLPQASLYATSHVDVYSWQNGLNSSQKVYLDAEEIKSGKQTEIADPKPAEIPDFYKKLATYVIEDKKFDFTKSGTLVVWKDCDRLNPKTKKAIFDRFEKEIGKKFRHYIHKKKCEIWVITIAEETGHVEDLLKIKPNDPLLLMEDNWILGDKENPGQKVNPNTPNPEPIFEPYPIGSDGKRIEKIKYRDSKGEIKEGEVTVQFSIVKDKFYDKAFLKQDPGDTPIGKLIKDKVGISVVRHDREIDFGKFDYFDDTNKPTHRWWGCEISFEPILDEVFGVSNNKQQVELRETTDKFKDIDEEVEPLWNQLKFIKSMIDDMDKDNKKRRAGTRSHGISESIKPIPTPTQTIVNAIEKENLSDQSEKDFPAITREEAIKLIEEDKEDPSAELIEFWQNQKVKFYYENHGKLNLPFSFGQKYGLATVDINLESSFYERLIKPLEENETAKTMFELLLASYSLALQKLSTYQDDEDYELTKKWISFLDQCLDKMKK